jgi:hypothetical protein
MTPLFVPLSSAAVSAPRPAGSASPQNWTIASAETLLAALPGVLSARVVGAPGDSISEIHLITTQDAHPQKTVREAEAALRVRFGVNVDGDSIFITQDEEPGVLPPVRAVPQRATVGPPRRDGAPARSEPGRPSEPARGGEAARRVEVANALTPVPNRIRFLGLRTESRRSGQMSLNVELEWHGRRQRGEAVGPDVPKAKLETAANATLRAIEIVSGHESESSTNVGQRLGLEGVQIVDAFEARYVLVAVHAVEGRRVRPLSGSALIEDSVLEATVLAILKATDRWLRGRGWVDRNGNGKNGSSGGAS